MGRVINTNMKKKQGATSSDIGQKCLKHIKMILHILILNLLHLIDRIYSCMTS